MSFHGWFPVKSQNYFIAEAPSHPLLNFPFNRLCVCVCVCVCVKEREIEGNRERRELEVGHEGAIYM